MHACSPLTRQDARGTWESQGRTRDPFKHGSVYLAFGELFSALPSVHETCKDLPVLCKNYSSASPQLRWILFIYYYASLPTRDRASKKCHEKKCKEMAWKKIWHCPAAGSICLSAGPCWTHRIQKEYDKHSSRPGVEMLEDNNKKWWWCWKFSDLDIWQTVLGYGALGELYRNC